MAADPYRVWEPPDTEDDAHECEADDAEHAAEMYADNVNFGGSDDRDWTKPLDVMVKGPDGQVRRFFVEVEFVREYTASEET